MGKNVLKIPGVVLRNPSTLLRLFAFVFVFVGVMSNDMEHFNTDIMDDLDFKDMLPSAQWNVSQAEYESKIREYFKHLELLDADSHYEEKIIKKKLYSFNVTGGKDFMLDKSGRRYIGYLVNIPEVSNKITEIEEAFLRLMLVPRNCTIQKRSLKIRLVNSEDKKLITEEKILLTECLPKWIEIQLPHDFSLERNEPFRVTIECAECIRQDVELDDPFLNVIVNLKSKFRTRRCETRLNRFRGRCKLHFWEVDLTKIKGFNYVVQPKKFNAGICAGRCNDLRKMHTQHAHFQLMYFKKNKTIPRPCCAPWKTKNLEVLFVHPDKPDVLDKTVWNHTIIEQCGCV